MRSALGWLLIAALAVGALVAGRTAGVPVHVLPHAGRTLYYLNVFADGRSLASDEVERRYRIPIRGATVLTPEGLRAIIRQREREHAGEGEAYVRLHTRLDGGAEEIWLWPES